MRMLAYSFPLTSWSVLLILMLTGWQAYVSSFHVRSITETCLKTESLQAQKKSLAASLILQRQQRQQWWTLSFVRIEMHLFLTELP